MHLGIALRMVKKQGIISLMNTQEGYQKILPKAELRNQLEVIHKCMDYLIWLFTP